MPLSQCGMKASSVKDNGPSGVFGKCKEPHTLIIARGDDIRHVTVKPWMTAVLGSMLVVAAVGYLFATAYLVLRDDLIGAAAARQARMQQSYEDRIAALRAQLDRVTSRQLLDQQLVETKVGELLLRQSQLSERHGRLTPVLGTGTAVLPEAGPLPSRKPDERAGLLSDRAGTTVHASADASSPFSFWSVRSAEAEGSAADRADKMFVAINQSLRSIEADQLQKLDVLASSAFEEAAAISSALQSAGFKVEDDFGKTDVGGPLVPVDTATLFDSKVKGLDEALGKLDALKKETRRLPLANPAPGRDITSKFGVRTDPLLGTPAMHAGMDFRAPTGAPILATGAGTVVRAGWSGGYGNLVEIEHAKGFSTRFAHMSKILVKAGDRVLPGDVIGRVGSTGRSTGPHLHYEIHREGDALDPLRFIRAGQRMSKFVKKI